MFIGVCGWGGKECNVNAAFCFLIGSSNKSYFLPTLFNLYGLEIPPVIWNMARCDERCLKNERQVLLDIHGTMSGKDWRRKWDIDTNSVKLNTSFHCDWYGILCDNKTKHIMAIFLSGNNVHGELPVNVSSLQFLLSFRIGSNSVQGKFEDIVAAMPMHLIRLEIANSDITGEIPKDIANHLPILSKLQMSGSKVSGELPDSIGDLIHLTVLSLGETQINGSIPQTISKLKNLWFLDLETLKLKGNLSFLYNLRNLSFLHLSSNEISGSIPEYIGESCPNLRDLRLSNNKLSGNLPRSLGALKILEEMNVEKNDLSGLIPVDLFNLNLKVLVLSSNKFTEFEKSDNGTFLGLTLFRASHLSVFNCSLHTILSYLKGSANSIMQIDISYSNIYGQIPNMIYSFNKLALLKLASNRLSGKIPAPSRNLPFFTLVDLQENDLSGAIPLTFSRLKMLTELNVKGNKWLRGPVAPSFMLLDYEVRIKERESDTCPIVRFAHNNGTVYMDSSYYDKQYCHCNENYFGNGKRCIPCIFGGTCNGTTATVSNGSPIKQLAADQVQLPVSLMLLKQGWYPFPDELNVKSIHECPSSGFKICVPEDNCGCYVNTFEGNIEKPGSVVHAEMQTRIYCNKSCLCALGHQGRHCSQCIGGYYKDGIHCYQCPKRYGTLVGIPVGIIALFVLSFYIQHKVIHRKKIHLILSAFSLIFIIVLALVLVLAHVIPVVCLQIIVIIAFLRYMGHFENCAGLFKSAMFYLQVMDSLVSTTDILPKFIYTNQVYASISLNFRFSSLACILHDLYTPLGKNIKVVVLPFIAIGFLWLIYCVMKCCRRKDWFEIDEDTLSKWKRKFRKYSITILDLAYFPVVKSFFSVIVGCDDIEGVSFMTRYVWIDCKSAEYSFLRGFAVFQLACYVIAVPVFVYIPLLICYRKEVAEDEKTTCEWLAPLIAPYKSKYKWCMEIPMLFRRLSIACLLEMLPANSPEQVHSTTIVLVVAIISQAIVRPFKIPTKSSTSDERYMGLENGIDIFMLSCVLISFVYAGVFAGSGGTTPLTWSILGINGLFCLVLSCSVIHRIFINFLSKVSGNIRWFFSY